MFHFVTVGHQVHTVRHTVSDLTRFRRCWHRVNLLAGVSYLLLRQGDASLLNVCLYSRSDNYLCSILARRFTRKPKTGFCATSVSFWFRAHRIEQVIFRNCVGTEAKTETLTLRPAKSSRASFLISMPCSSNVTEAAPAAHGKETTAGIVAWKNLLLNK